MRSEEDDERCGDGDSNGGSSSPSIFLAKEFWEWFFFVCVCVSEYFVKFNGREGEIFMKKFSEF